MIFTFCFLKRLITRYRLPNLTTYYYYLLFLQQLFSCTTVTCLSHSIFVLAAIDFLLSAERCPRQQISISQTTAAASPCGIEEYRHGPRAMSTGASCRFTYEIEHMGALQVCVHKLRFWVGRSHGSAHPANEMPDRSATMSSMSSNDLGTLPGRTGGSHFCFLLFLLDRIYWSD